MQFPPFAVGPLAALFVLAPSGVAQVSGDVFPGTVLDTANEAVRLFANADATLSLTGFQLFAYGVTLNCGESPLNQQIGLARGFDGANGLILSNGYVEDVDDDNVALGSPTGCIQANGATGVPFCVAVDPLLASLGPTEDAAVLILRFAASVPTQIDVAYEFVTHEDPADPAFYDVFGIFFDNVMVAGGSSNGGPAIGTDPWVLAPSSTLPHEFQSFPGSSLALVPAARTGRRVVTLDVPVGNHKLEFHVADSGPFQFCGTGTSDSTVVSSLLFGLHTWRGDDAAGVTPTALIDIAGHAAPDDTNGGAFPADFQVTLEGAPIGATAFLLRGQAVQSPPALLPSLVPLEILVGPSPVFEATLLVDALGMAAYPNPPVPLPAALIGTSRYFQWFGLAPDGTYFATKGVRARF
ncbi:MAG: hypothetical protein WD226_11325 [Planctomycetota bacterium]